MQFARYPLGSTAVAGGRDASARPVASEREPPASDDFQSLVSEAVEWVQEALGRAF